MSYHRYEVTITKNGHERLPDVGHNSPFGYGIRQENWGEVDRAVFSITFEGEAALCATIEAVVAEALKTR